MSEPLFTLGGISVTIGGLITLGAILLAIVVVAILVRSRRQRVDEDAAVEARVAELVRAQNEMSGRMQTMAEIFGTRQAELLRGLSERMDGLGQHLGQSLTDGTRNTSQGLASLNERISIIDQAQQKITSLSSQVVQLNQILANKQTRGAFGQGRMEAIIQDGLAPGSYQFQATLSNGKRPDCVIRLPNGAAGLVIDAKFPLEAWNAIRAAEGAEAVRLAEMQFRRDTLTHIQDIASRYLLPGETQDLAFMFVPSESIFADIHERFDDVVQKAHRAHVVIVSPSLLMLAIQVMQSVLRDAQMREQAHVIRDEVMKMMDDVRRLDDRVKKLRGHFGQVTGDVETIVTSTGKIIGHAEKIEAVKFSEDAIAPKPAPVELPAELPFRQIEET
jgi:DNA recombination protein RmuC